MGSCAVLRLAARTTIPNDRCDPRDDVDPAGAVARAAADVGARSRGAAVRRDRRVRSDDVRLRVVASLLQSTRHDRRPLQRVLQRRPRPQRSDHRGIRCAAARGAGRRDHAARQAPGSAVARCRRARGLPRRNRPVPTLSRPARSRTRDERGRAFVRHAVDRASRRSLASLADAADRDCSGDTDAARRHVSAGRGVDLPHPVRDPRLRDDPRVGAPLRARRLRVEAEPAEQ